MFGEIRTGGMNVGEVFVDQLIYDGGLSYCLDGQDLLLGKGCESACSMGGRGRSRVAIGV